MAKSLTLDRQHSALLVMDYQNDILARAGEAPQALLDRATTVLAAARAAGLPIIYVVVAFREGYPEVSTRNRSFATMKASGRLLDGTPGAAIHARVAPQPGDVVVVKRRVGAFSTTDLATVLRARELTTLILMGVSTSGVVLSTVRWAADADYDLVVVEDCCLDADDEVHRVLTQKVFPRQTQVVTAGEVCAALTQGE
ncbi:MAG TPA: isochorismatase family cysteine hydrolase [Ktedonobacterales bacterium]|nr:isochorismatase family cysteine hydrolase [Ktedonobacterales bacterium]